MRCKNKKCGGYTVILDSADDRRDNELYRLRGCTKCGRCFYTVEFPIDINKQFIDNWQTFHRTHKKVIFDMLYSPNVLQDLAKNACKHKKGGKNEI